MLDVQLDLDTGRWNVGSSAVQPIPRRRPAARSPPIQLHGGKLRYSKVSGGKAEVVMSVPVEARFGSGPEPRRATASRSRRPRSPAATAKATSAGTGGRASSRWPADCPRRICPRWSGRGRWTSWRANSSTTSNGDYKLDLRMKDLHGKQAPEVGALQLIAPAEARRGPGRLRSSSGSSLGIGRPARWTRSP